MRTIHPFSAWQRGVATLLLFCLCFVAEATTYSYDELGRLKTVTNASGETAEYVYDAVGSILEVKRYSAGTVAVTGFSPRSAPAGAEVTVKGTGFSPSPAQNQVEFNGVVASVVAATATTLNVTVPAAATSGPIRVMRDGQSALSAEAFTVTPSDGAPTIASLSASCVLQDQTFTITGSNFDTRAGMTRVEVGAKLAVVTVLSDTSLRVTVPRKSAGGKVVVRTPAGAAVSDTLLLVTEQGMDCSRFSGTAWLTVDGAAQPLAMPAGKYYVVYFEGSTGQWLSVQASAMSTTPAGGSLQSYNFAPDGSTVTGYTLYAGTAQSHHFAPMPASGVYAMRIYASSATTVSLKVESAAVARKDGSAVVTAMEKAQSKRVLFDAGKNEALGIGFEPTLGAADLALYSTESPTAKLTSAGPSRGSCSFGTANNDGNCGFVLPRPARSATYAAHVAARTGTVEGRVWVSSDLVGDLDGPRKYTFGRVGQSARLRFSGTAGGDAAISASGLTLGHPLKKAFVSLFAPNGSLLPTAPMVPDSLLVPGGIINPVNLPATGTYELLLTPDFGATGSAMIGLDPGLPLAPNGAAANFGASEGKVTRLLLDTHKDAKLGIGFTDIVVNPGAGNSSPSLVMEVYAPNGIQAFWQICKPTTPAQPGCEIDLVATMNGRYTLLVRPNGPVTSSSATIHTTIDKEVELGDQAGGVSIDRFGGNARLKFYAEPGAGKTVHVTKLVSDPAQRVGVTILRPDGVVLSGAPLLQQGFQATADGMYQIGDFPLKGIYEVFIDPLHAGKASLEGRITDGVDVPTGSQVPPTQHLAVVPGPWWRSTFSAMVGQHVAFGALLSRMPQSTAQLYVFNPEVKPIAQYDLKPYASCELTRQSCDFDLPEITQGGQYQVLMEFTPGTKPEQFEIGGAAVHDQEITGKTGQFTLARGQNARLRFDLNQSQRPSITITRTSPAGAGRDVKGFLWAPNGSTVASFTLSASQTTLTLTPPAAPMQGSYILFMDPEYGYGTSLDVTVQ
ncbi:IPT/TIG domain-containing protein [Tahibacter amnicola]|uniref:IPT/TIG domain-containing protein n=1 Tax=Tahibacter amnicola TaxID=2976241 RepID=A0ABY6BEQ5_9GAMM|nr:IPT/TIG domain-containing protein [Tahibacter amnicola]UXI68267.1 IPT/TIG domain-containing protein [Tahibacter amnicola]